MSGAFRVSPHRLRYTLDCVRELPAGGTQDGDWDTVRSLLSATDKYRSIVQRYKQKMPWKETDLFRNVYQVRFDRGEEKVRGCASIEALAKQYHQRVDGLYRHMRKHGFVERLEGRTVPLPNVYLARDGEIMLGNNGNHRVAMAQVLDLPYVLARVEARHPLAPDPECEIVVIEPELHDGAIKIPAMTTLEERLAYYELTKRAAKQGAIVELGTWLGAATAYIAAGIRDAGATKYGPVHTYDRFKWQAIHEYKAGKPLRRSMVDQVTMNLGPLARLVEIHKGEIAEAKWSGEPISLLVADGPKRVSEIAKTLQIFGPYMAPNAWTAWQDFAYFPAYDIPACFEQLERAGKVRFIEGIHPGTTAVFRIEATIDSADTKRLSLDSIRTDEILPIWEWWSSRLPEGGRGRFMVGAALFLCDRGNVKQGTKAFRAALDVARDDIAAKFKYLREKRPSFVAKYSSLFAEL